MCTSVSAIAIALVEEVAEVGLPPESLLRLFRADPALVIEQAVRACDNQRTAGTLGDGIEEGKHLNTRQTESAESRNVEMPHLVWHGPGLRVGRCEEDLGVVRMRLYGASVDE